jgi:LysM repeat protein
VARLFIVDVEDLLKANGLVEGEIIYPGDVLIIPGQIQTDDDDEPQGGPPGIIVP